MKKIIKLFTVLIGLSILVSCVQSDYADIRDDRGQLVTTFPIFKFNVENHDYIMFGNGHGKSIIHNPNCNTCKEEKTKFIEEIKQQCKTEEYYNW